MFKTSIKQSLGIVKFPGQNEKRISAKKATIYSLWERNKTSIEKDVKTGKSKTSLDNLDFIFNWFNCCNVFLPGSILHYGPNTIDKK